MANSNPRPMTLGPDDINELDEALLDLLIDGRVTPSVAKRALDDAGWKTTLSRQYINQRLIRLAEHRHLENLYETGVYELKEDPRDD